MPLPGHSQKNTDASVCCETEGHEHRPATWKVQGETDSFGCEYLYSCDECMEAIRRAPPRTGCCDWCKATDVEVFPRRDADEGLNGPVYDVCRPCIQKDNEALHKEAVALWEELEKNKGTEPWGDDDDVELTRQQEKEFEEALLTPS